MAVKGFITISTYPMAGLKSNGMLVIPNRFNVPHQEGGECRMTAPSRHLPLRPFVGIEGIQITGGEGGTPSFRFYNVRGFNNLTAAIA